MSEDSVSIAEFIRAVKQLGQWRWFPLLYIIFVALVAALLHHQLYGSN